AGAFPPRCTPAGCHGCHVVGEDGTCTTGLPSSVHERALSATDLSYEGRRLADTELLTPPPKHTTTAWDTCTGRTAPPPQRRLLWSLTPDAHHIACENAIDIGRWATYHGALS